MARGTSDRNKMRVGLVQTPLQLGDIDANLETVLDVVDGQRKRADLLVFPELTLTGYRVGAEYATLSMRADDPRLEQLRDASRDTAMAVGFIEETKRLTYHNSLAVFADGKLLGVHRKIFLPNYGIFDERKYFAPGRNYRTQELGFFRLGPLICGDAWNPGLAQLAAMQGATVMVCSVSSPEGGLGTVFNSLEGWQRCNRFYATMYGVYVIFVNRIGTEGDLSFWGGSELVDPRGRVVASLEGDAAGVAIGEIDLAVIRAARVTLPTVRDLDPSFMASQIKRLLNQEEA